MCVKKDLKTGIERVCAHYALLDAGLIADGSVHCSLVGDDADIKCSSLQLPSIDVPFTGSAHCLNLQVIHSQ